MRSEEYRQKNINGIMDRIGIPDRDSYTGRKYTFTGRVDLLVEYCEELRDELLEVTNECFKHTACHGDEEIDRLEKAMKLIRRSLDIAK